MSSIKLPDIKGLPSHFDVNRNIKTKKTNIYDFTDYKGSLHNQLYKVKLNQLKMLKDRGYDVDDELNEISDIQYFQSYYNDIKREMQTEPNKQITFKDALSRVYEYLGDGRNVGDSFNNKRILVQYIDTPVDGDSKKSIKTTQIRDLLLENVKKSNVECIMIITETQLTNGALKGLDLPSYTIETFTYNQLSYNPNDHVYVPKHTLLTESETKKLFESRKLKASTLPKIASDDPITRYFGAIPGQVFKIERINYEAETLIRKSIFYRIVSNDKITQ
jgi:DNA-directed RNA polymerase subunit H (RpoH/RPB5)